MWTYEQVTGWMSANDQRLAQGYAGNGEGKNNPDMQGVKGIGPLPKGRYTIQEPHDDPHTGKYTMNLEPDPGNQMFGRSLFRIHGDSVSDPGTASEGCIVLPRFARERIWESGDHSLEVVRGS